jgi:hypothetical protein
VVYYEDRVANIDLSQHLLGADLVSTALRCFNLPCAENFFVAFDAETLVVLPLNTAVDVSVVILKNANFFAPELVFCASGLNGFSNLTLIMLSKFFLTTQFKNLVTAVKHRNNKLFEIDSFPEAKLTQIIESFTPQFKVSDLSEVEQNSLLFLLLGASNQPLLSPAMHQFAHHIMAPADDAERWELALQFLALIPLEAYLVLSEISLIFGGIPKVPDNIPRIVGLLADILFKPVAHTFRTTQFLTFLLLTSESLFHFRRKPDRQLRKAGPRLILFEGAVAASVDGPSDLKLEATPEFAPAKGLARILAESGRRGAMAAPGFRPDGHTSEKLVALDLPVGDLDFDGLFSA